MFANRLLTTPRIHSNYRYFKMAASASHGIASLGSVSSRMASCKKSKKLTRSKIVPGKRKVILKLTLAEEQPKLYLRFSKEMMLRIKSLESK